MEEKNYEPLRSKRGFPDLRDSITKKILNFCVSFLGERKFYLAGIIHKHYMSKIE